MTTHGKGKALILALMALATTSCGTKTADCNKVITVLKADGEAFEKAKADDKTMFESMGKVSDKTSADLAALSISDAEVKTRATALADLSKQAAAATRAHGVAINALSNFKSKPGASEAESKAEVDKLSKASDVTTKTFDAAHTAEQKGWKEFTDFCAGS